MSSRYTLLLLTGLCVFALLRLFRLRHSPEVQGYGEHLQLQAECVELPDLTVQPGVLNAPWLKLHSAVEHQNATHRFCVYGDSSRVPNHGGVAILSRPEHAAKLAALSPSNDPTLAPMPKKTFHPPYEIRDIPGKGMGMVATRPIKRGEILLSEAPVLVVENLLYNTFSPAERRQHVNTALSFLPDTTVARYMELYHDPKSDPIQSTITRNRYSADLFSDDEHDAASFFAMLLETSVRYLIRA